MVPKGGCVRIRHPRAALAAALVAAALLTPLVHSGGKDAAPAGKDKNAKVAPANLCGRLATYDGLRVLELWGTPEEAGFAHGWLLAQDIVSLFDQYILDPSILRGPAVYETVLIPAVRRQFVWDPAYERELGAMCAGIVARLGRDGVRSEKLGRELGIADLMAANALADWHGVFCSSFSAWDGLTQNGQTITARNLDFPSTPPMASSQLVLVYRADERRAGWVGVSWPGLIGVYTAMNAHGVTMLMHDAAGLPASETDGFTPRSLILREALESARPGSYLDDVERVFAARRVMVGNNIHVSGPRGRTDPAALSPNGPPPAAVFEFDANRRGDGVTRRVPNADDADGQVLCCTNHMCDRVDRAPPRRSSSWDRFNTLNDAITRMRAERRTLDPAGALQVIGLVRRRDTLHTVVLQPDCRSVRVIIPAIHERVVEFHVAEWLGSPLETPYGHRLGVPAGG
jgi:hypothetical protein